MTVAIRLHEEKYYFPGETIKGCVTVHPKTPTRTSQITLRFSGYVQLAVRERETISMFRLTKHIPISAGILGAKPHLFPFEFSVPEDMKLPSAMELGKKARVRYTLAAIQDRPMVLEALCPKTEYSVPVLERIDTNAPQFARPLRHCIDVTPPHACNDQKCNVSISIPRTAFTRGDIIPLDIAVMHVQAYVLAEAVLVDLVRVVDIHTNRHATTKEYVMKSTKLDLNIVGSNDNFKQLIKCQLFIPPSTTPTVRYMDKLLHVHYKVRLRVHLAESKLDSDVCTLEIPFTVGTWPRAAVPIDDDNDEPPHSNSTSSISDRMNDMSIFDTYDSTLHCSSIKHDDHEGVGRSDSNASRSSSKSLTSLSSWKSGQSSWENSSAWSDPPLPSSLMNGNPRYSGGSIPIMLNSHSAFEPSLMARADPSLIPHRYSFHDTSGHPSLGRPGQKPAVGYTSQNLRHTFQPQEDLRHLRLAVNRATDVPTHILQPISSSLPLPLSPLHPPRQPVVQHVSLSPISAKDSQNSDSEEEVDDMDLLTILNKKRRQAHRAKQQEAM